MDEILIKNDKIKLEILKEFKMRDISYTASILAIRLNSKYETIKKALEFFSLIGIVEKEIKEHGKKIYTYYNLTSIGREFLKSNKI